MRRKSTRNVGKAAEKAKAPETPVRQTRRTTRRRKISESASASDASEDEVEVKSVETVEATTEKAQASGDDAMWKVMKTDSPPGEVQKLKISLSRSPSTPERTTRRRRNTSTQPEEESAAAEEFVRRTRQHGSPPRIEEEVLEEKEDKKGKGKSKGKTKSKIEKTPQVNELESQTQNEISENVQVTSQSPSDTDIPNDKESVPDVESNDNQQKSTTEEPNALETVEEEPENDERNVSEIIKTENSTKQYNTAELKFEQEVVKQEVKTEQLLVPAEQSVTTKKEEVTVDEMPESIKQELTNVTPAIAMEIVDQKIEKQEILELKEENVKVETNESPLKTECKEEIPLKEERDDESESSEQGNSSLKRSNSNLESALKTEQIGESIVEPEQTPNNKVDETTVTTTEIQSALVPEEDTKTDEKMTTAHILSDPVLVKCDNAEKTVTAEIQPIPVPVEEVNVEEKTANAELQPVEEVNVEEKKANAELQPVEEDKASTSEKQSTPANVAVQDNNVQEKVEESIKKKKCSKVILKRSLRNRSADKDNVGESAKKTPAETTLETLNEEKVVETATEATSSKMPDVMEQFEPKQDDQLAKDKGEVAKEEQEVGPKEASNTASNMDEDSATKEEGTNQDKKEEIGESQDVLKTNEDVNVEKYTMPLVISCKEKQPSSKEAPSEETAVVTSNNKPKLVEILRPSLKRELQGKSEEETKTPTKRPKKKIQTIKLNKTFAARRLTTNSNSEKPLTKRKWGVDAKFDLQKMTPNLQLVTFETLKQLYPDLVLLEEQDVKLEVSEVKDRRVSIDTKEKKRVDRKVSDASDSDRPSYETQLSENSVRMDSDVEDKSNIIAMNRKISIVDDSASKLKPPPSPAKHAVSPVLFITNLVRPFTLKQLKELLERTGKLKEDGFWTDRIKSKCYIHYETEEEAESTRNALHGVHWPIGNGKKLIIDFATREDLETARNPPVKIAEPPQVQEKENQEPLESANDAKEERRKEPHVREWDVGKEEMQKERARSRSHERPRADKRRHSRHSHSPVEDFISRKQKKSEEAVPQKLMDDLFQKTKAMPSIYWQPLTPEEIATKQQQRLQRMAEHKRRMEESSRTRNEFARGGGNRRRYD